LDDELKPYDDARTKVLEEAANKDKDEKAIIDEATRQYDIPEDKLQEALQEIEKLQNEDINIDIRKVTVEDINKAELTPRELMSIEFMLEV
jgi:predicted DNA binding protein